MPRLAGVLTSSETLSDGQRALLHRAFACPVSDHYGLAEMVASASRCERGAYHEDMEFCVHEYLPAEGAPGFNWLVGTSLANRAMPLIRYATGDLAVPSDEACACGRASRIITSLDGRIESLVVLPNGAKVGRLDHIFKDCLAIRDAQIVQIRYDGITIRVVRRPGFGPADERFLLGQVRMRLGSEIRVDMDYVEELPRGANGKIRAVMSTLVS
jgi:phenylacetate-CoA ligase